MNTSRFGEAVILGVALCIGLITLGYLVSKSAISVKRSDRTVVVKGLSEREVPANIAIWPITFNEADNDLNTLSSSIEKKGSMITDFLLKNGFKVEEISVSSPTILDRLAEGYVDAAKVRYRYSANITITVYSTDVPLVRKTMSKLVQLGKQGIAIAGQQYQARTEFLFTKLNEIKPDMIEEATKNARQVAEKFAKDSESKLGKIKDAKQGQFSITDRDSNTPYIKKVRVVSTVEYYLSD